MLKESKARKFLSAHIARAQHFLKICNMAALRRSQQSIKLVQSGADPGRNLTRAQPKVRGRGYMAMALCMGLDNHDMLKSSNSSVEFLTSLHKSKQLRMTLVLGGSAIQRTTAKCKEVGSSHNVELTSKGHSLKQKRQIHKLQRGPCQQFFENREGCVPPVHYGSYIPSQMAVILSK